MITETITFRFENEEQQRRFHERLKADAAEDEADAPFVQQALERMKALTLKVENAARAAAYEDAATIAEQWPNSPQKMEDAARWEKAGGWGNAVAASNYDIARLIRSRSKERQT